MAKDEIPTPDISAPKTILNRPVGPHRVFDAAEFPLEGFKDIKDAANVTVNDVALTVIGGALQRYLKARNEAPEGSLAATMPLNMRTRRGVTADNNQVGAVFASMHTDIEDPLERMQAIHGSTREAKESGEQSPMVDILKLAGAVSPFIARGVAGFWARNNLSQHIPINISTVVSNVAGPDFPLYCAGAKMVDYYGLGVLTPGMGIFHLVFSYSGKLTLSVLADRDIMPDPEFYHDCLVASYEETYAAATAQGRKAGKGKTSVAAKAKIDSPKRKRGDKAAAKAKPKSAGKPKGASAKPKAKAKSATKPKAKAKRKAAAKRPAKPKAKAKATPKTASRPRAGKPDLKVVPKLKAVS